MYNTHTHIRFFLKFRRMIRNCLFNFIGVRVAKKRPTRMMCTKCINQYITGFASSYPHERNNWACRSTSSKSPQLYPIWVCLKIGNPGLLPNPAVNHNFSSMAINWGPTRPPYILSHTKMILSEIYYTKQNGANHISQPFPKKGV